MSARDSFSAAASSDSLAGRGAENLPCSSRAIDESLTCASAASLRWDSPSSCRRRRNSWPSDLACSWSIGVSPVGNTHFTRKYKEFHHMVDNSTTRYSATKVGKHIYLRLLR